MKSIKCALDCIPGHTGEGICKINKTKGERKVRGAVGQPQKTLQRGDVLQSVSSSAKTGLGRGEQRVDGSGEAAEEKKVEELGEKGEECDEAPFVLFFWDRSKQNEREEFRGRGRVKEFIEKRVKHGEEGGEFEDFGSESIVTRFFVV